MRARSAPSPASTVLAQAHPSESSGQSKPPAACASGLYLIATPIGNRRDITLRALDILAAADLVLCEDTRVSQPLLAHYGLAPKLLSYHAHNERERLPAVLAALAAGQVVALLSDAGMPLISDPGAPLVQAVKAAGYLVSIAPGANAALSALCLSGLPGDRFCFIGFLPPKTNARQQALAPLLSIPATLIFYESPHRLTDLLADLALLAQDRAVVVARELTKLHEDVRSGPAQELLAHYMQTPARGECVVLLAPPLAGPSLWPEAQLLSALKEELTHRSARDAAAILAAQSGWAKREVYARAIALGRK